MSFTKKFGRGPVLKLREHHLGQRGEAYYFDLRDPGTHLNASGVVAGPIEFALRQVLTWYPQLKEGTPLDNTIGVGDLVEVSNPAHRCYGETGTVKGLVRRLLTFLRI